MWNPGFDKADHAHGAGVKQWQYHISPAEVRLHLCVFFSPPLLSAPTSCRASRFSLPLETVCATRLQPPDTQIIHGSSCRPQQQWHVPIRLASAYSLCLCHRLLGQLHRLIFEVSRSAPPSDYCWNTRVLFFAWTLNVQIRPQPGSYGGAGPTADMWCGTARRSAVPFSFFFTRKLFTRALAPRNYSAWLRFYKVWSGKCTRLPIKSWRRRESPSSSLSMEHI